MGSLLLPVFPNEVTRINDLLAFCCRDDTVFYFYGHLNPVFHHHKDDKDSFDMINSQFYSTGKATQAEICKAFGIPKIRMKRAAKIYRDHGIKGFYSKESNSKSRILTPEVKEKVEDMLMQGMKLKDIANRLKLKYDTLYRAVKEGKIKKKFRSV
jgi:transposase-like protein